MKILVIDGVKAKVKTFSQCGSTPLPYAVYDGLEEIERGVATLSEVQEKYLDIDKTVLQTKRSAGMSFDPLEYAKFYEITGGK